MKYLCVHGHFYQPPRENPWLEAIELQDSAYPYHDWNARITAESYAPNAATRILDSKSRIEQIVNNYSRISFNFGPTVLSWAEENAPELYRAIQDADQESKTRFGGHGSAIAQAYNHMIMPLASSRDKYTQAIWGIEDFRHRFGREPEGMWLPETAVDLESLDILAELGIKFTILAPSQAHRFRAFGAKEWEDVSGGRIDPTRPYRLTTPSGRKIALFFYDGPVSRAVAFEQLLNNGEVFARRLLSVFSNSRSWPQLAHIATDGESYGHHHRYGEMALAYALDHIEANKLAKLTNYGEFLASHPPEHDVEIFERTAWSCVHGVGRWERDCSCNSGAHAGWNQAWRGPLRNALDWLRDEVAPKYQARLSRFLIDPWQARDAYIQVVLNRSIESRENFLVKHAVRPLTGAEQVQVWKLLELQRHAMLMYTSCGWFFDEISGIETVQVINYAGRVVQLAEQLFGEPLELQFLELLGEAKSNVPEQADGRHIYLKHVRPSMVDLRKVGAHYAISSLFRVYPEHTRIYCYRVDREDLQINEAGRLRLAIGRARFTSDITQETGTLFFGVLHLGDHNLTAGVRAYHDPKEYEDFSAKVLAAFSRADAPQVLRYIDAFFENETFSLKSLFRDEQRAILDEMLTSSLEDAETVYRQLYERNAPLMRFLADLHAPLPKAFQTTAQYALNSHLRLALAAEMPDLARIQSLLAEAKSGNVELDATTLEFTLRTNMENLAQQLRTNVEDQGALNSLTALLSILKLLPFPVNLWNVQNAFYSLIRNGNFQKLDRGAAAKLKNLAEQLSLSI